MQPLPLSKWVPLSEYLRQITEQKDPSKSETPLPAVKFFNRELSWLAFNDRVLAEAEDPSVPPLERLHFAVIVSMNLDEFFMVRVAEVRRAQKRWKNHRSVDPNDPGRVLAQIRAHVLRQKERQAKAFEDITRVLSDEGIHVLSDFSEFRNEQDQEIIRKLPEINLIVRKLSEPLPALDGDLIHCFVRFREEFAVISIADRPNRLLSVSSSTRSARYVLLERWLCARAPHFFQGREVLEAFPFKIIRDADLFLRVDDPDTFEEQIVRAVGRRSKARLVRLEVDAPAYTEGVMLLGTMLGLDSASLYRFNLPLDLRTILPIYRNHRDGKLSYKPVEPVVPACVQKQKALFEAIRKKDILLHHPYDSFDVIVDFLKQAARDEDVTQIYHTLYRTSKESPIMEALVQAAKSGKKVTVYVEIKARFDELNNVRWATALRAAGAKVIRPMKDLKVHSKLTQVVRTENGQDIYYTHLGTGNYHPGTARHYTDLGLLTADEGIGREAARYFEMISGVKNSGAFTQLLVAPKNLDQEFLKMIRAETQNQKNGVKGRIKAKMNSLVDPNVIEALYAASQAGVKIDLMVRGICCLKPGVKGLSETIRVTSVVDRFLEHSRIYYFRAGGEKKVFLSSADWMPRNFNNRFEIAFPVKDPKLKQFVLDVILRTSLSDNQKAWILHSDGNYHRPRRQESTKALRSQFVFEELAAKGYAGTVLNPSN